MSNKKDLKAFVRFDGSQRVVAGSLILRRNKPRVGKWQQIQAYECCNLINVTFTMCSLVEGRTGDFQILVIPNRAIDANVVLAITATDNLGVTYLETVTILIGNSSGLSNAVVFTGLGASIASVVINSASPATSVTQTYVIPGIYENECIPV